MPNSQAALDVAVGKQEVQIQNLQDDVKELRHLHREASEERKKMASDIQQIQSLVKQINQKVPAPAATVKTKLGFINQNNLTSLTLFVLVLAWIFGPEKALTLMARIIGGG